MRPINKRRRIDSPQNSEGSYTISVMMSPPRPAQTLNRKHCSIYWAAIAVESLPRYYSHEAPLHSSAVAANAPVPLAQAPRRPPPR